MLAFLIKTGRWLSVSSLAVYLVDVDRELAALLKVMCSRGGRMAPHAISGQLPEAEPESSTARRKTRRREASPSREGGQVAALWAQWAARPAPALEEPEAARLAQTTRSLV
jgi:hypothetical protein